MDAWGRITSIIAVYFIGEYRQSVFFFFSFCHVWTFNALELYRSSSCPSRIFNKVAIGKLSSALCELNS